MKALVFAMISALSTLYHRVMSTILSLLLSDNFRTSQYETELEF